MKAAYLKAPFRVEIRDIPEPTRGAGEVMLKPKLVGICGTDIQLARELAEDWMRFGHEPVAEVVDVGPGVTNLKPGDIVACQASSACGYCAGCLMGRPEDCGNRSSTRVLDYFAEFVAVNLRNVWKVDGLSPKEAVLLEPMGMAFDINRLAEVGLESRVAVLGPGPIGLMAIHVARARGARRIYVLGTTADA